MPDSPAVRLGDAELSYAELDDLSARLATLLVEKGAASRATGSG